MPNKRKFQRKLPIQPGKKKFSPQKFQAGNKGIKRLQTGPRPNIPKNNNPPQNSIKKTTTANTNQSKELKAIIIDGSNVAFEHGKVNNVFSSRGIRIAVDYFLNRGHTVVKALIPRYRRTNTTGIQMTIEPEILDELAQRGNLDLTPSRYLNGKLIVPYDDRFILEAALHYNAVIVSNDNYSDVKIENPEWNRLVDSSLLQFMFVGDLFMVASDPMGRYGPNLNQFLSKPNEQKLVQVPQAKKSPIKNNPKPKDTSLAVNLQNNRTNQVQNNEAVFRFKPVNAQANEQTKVQAIEQANKNATNKNNKQPDITSNPTPNQQKKVQIKLLSPLQIQTKQNQEQPRKQQNPKKIQQKPAIQTINQQKSTIQTINPQKPAIKSSQQIKKPQQNRICPMPFQFVNINHPPPPLFKPFVQPNFAQQPPPHIQNKFVFVNTNIVRPQQQQNNTASHQMMEQTPKQLVNPIKIECTQTQNNQMSRKVFL